MIDVNSIDYFHTRWLACRFANQSSEMKVKKIELVSPIYLAVRIDVAVKRKMLLNVLELFFFFSSMLMPLLL